MTARRTVAGAFATTVFLLVCVGWASPARAAQAPVVRVTPALSVEDQRVVIRVQGLAPHQPVSVGLRSTDAKGFDWSSSARFVADARGSVDSSRSFSRGGSYTGVWAMGLIASMRVAVKDPNRLYFWRRSGPALFALTVRARGDVVASSTFRRSWTRRRLTERNETVSSAGFVGRFEAPAGVRSRTSVLVFGGSEGGLRTGLLAARFAADGVPALALAYFRAPGLPQTLTDIPLEYFRRALAWLAEQPQVDPSRIVVLGISRGSEAALLLGVHYPAVVHGVIALVPSSVVNCGIEGAGSRIRCDGPAWTFRGKPLPYTLQFDEPSPTDVPAAVIPVERIEGPILLACGGIDQTWVSCPFSDAITSRLDRDPVKYRHVTYAYLDAGHDVGALLPAEPGFTQYDRNVPFDEQAREQLWPHVLRFVAAIR